MPLIDSMDYVARLIYLHSDTMDADLDTIDVYREARALRATNEAHQKFKPMIVAGGNIAKITGLTYTAAFAQLLYGCRIVPCDDADHKIKLIRDTFTDDGFAGRDCFDRSGLTHKVDIDVDFPEIETRVIAGGSGLSVEEHDQLMALPGAGADPWASEIEGSHTAQDILRYLLSFIGGKASGAGTVAPVFRSTGDVKNRIVMTVDENGNRTAVVLDGGDE